MTSRITSLSSLALFSAFAIGLVSPGFAGFTPDRTGIEHPQTTDVAAFNNYIDSTSAQYEDERAFSLVSRDDLTGKADSLEVGELEGEQIILHAYLNNSGIIGTIGTKVFSDSFYQNKQGQYVTPAFTDSLDVTHSILTSNLDSSVVTDTATVVSEDGVPLRLRYVADDNKMWVRPLQSGGYNQIDAEDQTDFFSDGVLVGSKNSPLSGVFFPGDDQTGDDQRVEFQYRVIVERAEADLSLSRVPVRGVDIFNISVDETFLNVLEYENAGEIEASNVVITDDYDQARVAIVAGSWPREANCSDDGDVFRCELGELPKRATGQISYQVEAIARGNAFFTPTISSDAPDLSPNNNSLSNSVNIVGADLVEPGDIVINELMWAGSDASTADEWIELRNTTDKDIGLAGFQLTRMTGSGEQLMIEFTEGTIPANGFFLISNYSEDNTNSVLNVTPDLVDSALTLSNESLQIRLYDGWFFDSNLIDVAGDIGQPLAGRNESPKASMARNFLPGDGTNLDNWFTHQSSNGFRSESVERGSPGNSLSSFSQGFSEIIHEQGVSVSDWRLYDGTPSGPVTPTVDAVDGFVQIRGNGTQNGWRKYTKFRETSHTLARWDWALDDEDNATFYWGVLTNEGQKFVTYRPNNRPCYLSRSRNYFICGVGSEIIGGDFYTITRDLQKDIHMLSPSTNIVKIHSVWVRGDTRIDNIGVLADAGLSSITGNVTVDGVSFEKAVVSFSRLGGGTAPVAVETDANGNYSQTGFEQGVTYTVEITDLFQREGASLGATFTNNSTDIFIDSANEVENFVGVTSGEVVFEDGNDVFGWVAHAVNPSIPITPEAIAEGGFIRIVGNGLTNGFKQRLINPHVNTQLLVAEWDWAITDTDQGVFFFQIGSDIDLPGQRSSDVFVAYRPNNDPCFYTDFDIGDHHVICGVGTDMTNNNFARTTRDLEDDINTTLQSEIGITVNVTSVKEILQRGNMRVDNIKLKDAL